MSKSSGDERGRVLSDSSKDRSMVLEDLAASVIGGQVLELIQTQMTQKPMLRAEVYARALRASQNRKEARSRGFL